MAAASAAPLTLTHGTASLLSLIRWRRWMVQSQVPHWMSTNTVSAGLTSAVCATNTPISMSVATDQMLTSFMCAGVWMTSSKSALCLLQSPRDDGGGSLSENLKHGILLIIPPANIFGGSPNLNVLCSHFSCSASLSASLAMVSFWNARLPICRNGDILISIKFDL